MTRDDPVPFRRDDVYGTGLFLFIGVNAKLMLIMIKFQSDFDAIEAIVPGVFKAYESLMAPAGMGIYTSNGAFFNHTLFGRDATMSAKFVSDFDHETTRKVIVALAGLQGIKEDPVTQEAPGRIHHELRDFHEWKGRASERLILKFFSRMWGEKHGQLLTYFATDTTANYIRLVNKFCHRIDPSLLDMKVKNYEGVELTIAESVELAADWIVKQLDDRARLMTVRAPHSLPYQTFQDSVTAYAWNDKRAVNYRLPHSFVEVQAFGADALEDASRLLSGRTSKTATYRDRAHDMRRVLMSDYWDVEKHYFSSVLSERDGVLKPLDVPNISAGWTLNTSWWDEMPVHDRSKKISSIVNRLFSDEFLTDVGLRTRSKYAVEPLGGVIDYHGSQTVWPMFNFMVIEGLRRHRMYLLADQLERRLINGVNVNGQFSEFLIVDKQGKLLVPKRSRLLSYRRAQMVPEKEIAFTIVPMMTIARRVGTVPPQKPPKDWHEQLENDVLSRIQLVPLIKPEDAMAELRPTKVYLSRTGATLRSAWHVLTRKAR